MRHYLTMTALLVCSIFIGCTEETVDIQTNSDHEIDMRSADPFSDVGWFPFLAHTVFDPCTGEEVHFPDGEFHQSIHGVVTPSGNVHFSGHLNFNLEGTGQTSGTTYHCILAQNHTENTSVGAQINIQVTQNLISEGEASNLYFSFTVQIIVNANGEVTVFIVDQSLECS